MPRLAKPVIDESHPFSYSIFNPILKLHQEGVALTRDDSFDEKLHTLQKLDMEVKELLFHHTLDAYSRHINEGVVDKRKTLLKLEQMSSDLRSVLQPLLSTPGFHYGYVLGTHLSLFEEFLHSTIVISNIEGKPDVIVNRIYDHNTSVAFQNAKTEIRSLKTFNRKKRVDSQRKRVKELDGYYNKLTKHFFEIHHKQIGLTLGNRYCTMDDVTIAMRAFRPHLDTLRKIGRILGWVSFIDYHLDYGVFVRLILILEDGTEDIEEHVTNLWTRIPVEKEKRNLVLYQTNHGKESFVASIDGTFRKHQLITPWMPGCHRIMYRSYETRHQRLN